MSGNVKQVIVVRMTYPDGEGGTRKVRFGKLAAQVAHASGAVFFDRGEVLVDTSASDDEPPFYFQVDLDEDMASWVEGSFAKIVLLVEDEESLLLAHKLAKEAGLPTSLITDHGRTEFRGVPTHTTVAIGPAQAEAIDKITGPQGAVATRLA